MARASEETFAVCIVASSRRYAGQWCCVLQFVNCNRIISTEYHICWKYLSPAPSCAPPHCKPPLSCCSSHGFPDIPRESSPTASCLICLGSKPFRRTCPRGGGGRGDRGGVARGWSRSLHVGRSFTRKLKVTSGMGGVTLQMLYFAAYCKQQSSVSRVAMRKAI